MIRYGKKKHAGFWCECKYCDPDRDERMTNKRRARRAGRREIAQQTAPLDEWSELMPDLYWWAF